MVCVVCVCVCVWWVCVVCVVCVCAVYVCERKRECECVCNYISSLSVILTTWLCLAIRRQFVCWRPLSTASYQRPLNRGWVRKWPWSLARYKLPMAARGN